MHSIEPAPPTVLATAPATILPSAPASAPVSAPTSNVSPLTIADRLITLAQDADRAGYRDTASHLVLLVYTVLERRITH